ncbi:MAG: hypothetical protein ACLUUO_09635 [Sellimonas intestinalis]
MNNFDIVKLDNKEIKILVIMKTSDSPFDFVNELQQQLRTIDFLVCLLLMKYCIVAIMRSDLLVVFLMGIRLIIQNLNLNI